MIFRFFHYIGLLIVKIYVHSYFERKYDKVLTFNIAHFPNFEISASLLLAPPSNRCRTLQFQNLISAGLLIRGNAVVKETSENSGNYPFWHFWSKSNLDSFYPTSHT